MSGEIAEGPAAVLAWNRALLGEEEIAEAVDALRSGWLTTGPKTARFEAGVRELTGAEDAFAVNSCTAALHLALLAGGVGAGDEVITPSLTFCAIANVIARVGATPVLVDVLPDQLNLDPAAVAAAVSGRTRAIVAMHYGGHPCEMDELREIADQHGLLLIEDAAHAIGAQYRGRPVGSLGDLAAFSFYANKNITTGEGGMLVGRADLVRSARLLGRHGLSRVAWQRHGDRGPADYDVLEAGLKYNMSDVLAAVGVHQLKRLPEFLARRGVIAARYSQELAGLPGLWLPGTAADVRHAWHLYPVQVSPGRAGMDRDALAEALAAAGIATSIHFTPIHRLARYRDLADPAAMPHTERAADRLLSLPCYPAMTDDDVSRVIAAIRQAWGEPAP
ncbi:DegT/DnrJ/EryC1/StrS family aminotransferase [Micromonospora tulbaghiae]|uniref:DegT/DnrJ/EryC1/StrS family aminotransferase n=1 Tax=Micromonospora tulbaghiae TaxID=479978 RepID=UPI00340233E8